MRDAWHGKDGARCLRCAQTNALYRRPAIVSLAPPALPLITKNGARRSGSPTRFLSLESELFAGREFLAGPWSRQEVGGLKSGYI
jgi:hypothetical protein